MFALSEETRNEVEALLERQCAALDGMLEANAQMRGLCLAELGENYTLASRLNAGDVIVLHREYETVRSVTPLAGVVPHVVLRTNARVEVIPAGRVIERVSPTLEEHDEYQASACWQDELAEKSLDGD